MVNSTAKSKMMKAILVGIIKILAPIIFVVLAIIKIDFHPSLKILIL
jgi:hypothetical protein